MTQVLQTEGEEKGKKSVLKKDQRFVINLERNMILPAKTVIDTLTELSLPIYTTAGGGFKCHFKDVCIQLTKKAL